MPAIDRQNNQDEKVSGKRERFSGRHGLRSRRLSFVAIPASKPRAYDRRNTNGIMIYITDGPDERQQISGLVR